MDIIFIIAAFAGILAIIHVGTMTLSLLFYLADKIHKAAWLPLAMALMFLPFVADAHGFGI